MGLVLGLTLGAIGFVRASFTPESVRSSTPPRPEGFQVRLPKGSEELRQTVVEEGLLKKEKITIVDIPKGTEQTMVEDHPTKVSLPEGDRLALPTEDPNNPDYVVYHFPKNCKVHHPPVDRRKLSLVIALAVASICLWGTLIGSMLPLVFKRIGVDPGVASSPFVATFVDVTGIVIYFSIAKAVLWDVLT